jgi:flagellar biosynthesis/type III secretory pathway protein FliH
MQYESTRRVEIYAHAQDGLAALESNPEKRRKYVDFIDQYANLDDAELVQYNEVYLPQSAQREVIMGLMQRSREEGLQQGRQEGRQEGHQEGRQEGRQEGIREGLLAGITLGLELKFGAAGLRLLMEIEKIHSIETLRAIHERIKTADNPDVLRQFYREGRHDV